MVVSVCHRLDEATRPKLTPPGRTPRPAEPDDRQQVGECMKFFRSMSEYYDYLAASTDPDVDVEYAAFRDAPDAVAAFDLFVERNVDAERRARFADGSNADADLVRRAIRRRR